jgi:flagellar biosynthetic protein FlhB
VQGGLRPAPKLLKPQFKKLNPIAGFKRLVGPKSWWEGAKTLIKTLVLGLVLYMIVKDLVHRRDRLRVPSACRRCSKWPAARRSR